MESILQSPPAGRWKQMCARLTPLLGDVKAALGDQWHQKAETFFTEADFIVAETILNGVSPLPNWLIIEYGPAGNQLDDWGNDVACAPSWPDALAAVLGACENTRTLPSRVEFDHGTGALRFFAGEALMATVKPLPGTTVTPDLRQRALSTICGLRKSVDPKAELLKRVRRWPGMSEVEASEPRASHELADLLERMAHHPIPKEWLQSARLLCAACGKDNVDMRTAQAVAAAALGAPSWNHLAGPHGDRSAEMLQPWYIRTDGDVLGFHAAAVDAVADLFIRVAPGHTGGWSGIRLDSHYTLGGYDYVPRYVLSEPSNSPSALWFDRHHVVASPVPRCEPEPDVLRRVSGVTPADTDAIMALFGIGLPVDVKARMLDERSTEILIAQEGPWRITRTGDPRNEDTMIRVHRLGADGNAVRSTAVRAYKGLLQTHRESGSHVLCAEYDGDNPVEILDGLSPATVAQIRANLPDTGLCPLDFIEERKRDRDRSEFRRLLGRASTQRSVT